MTTDLREWIEERSNLIALLRSLRDAQESDVLIRRIANIVARRSRPEPSRGFLVTWESELRAIAAESLAWSVETGGDLFGRWNDVPTVLFASKAGPAAERNHAHFRLDVDYLRELSEMMASDWSHRYFGDWHSHHRLGLSSPSGGDRKRIISIAGRNQFTSMIEIIVTLDDSRQEPIVRIHPWIYDLTGQASGPFPLRVKVLPGLSPVRQALSTRRALPEQDLNVWQKVPLQRIRIGNESSAPSLEVATDVDTLTRERVIVHLSDALKTASGGQIEHHTSGFGTILVAKIRDPFYLAFALGSAWPMPILDIHQIDRNLGTTESIQARPGLIAADIAGIIEVFHKAGRTLKGDAHVDQ